MNNGTNVVRLGVVAFLNSRPLIVGLDKQSDIQLHFAVPAALSDMLRSGLVDVSLVPVIDLARSQGAWEQVSDACIGSEHETLTVRVFSRVSPERMTVLHVDGDSHTSVVLARLIWRYWYKRPIDIVPLPSNGLQKECESVLLIGDKVVTTPMADFEHTVDLGAAWSRWTGLPFVFAVWAAPVGRPDNARLGSILNSARDRGISQATRVAEEYAPVRGWPVDLAIQYLTHNLCFTMTPGLAAGMRHYLELAASEGYINPSASLPASPRRVLESKPPLVFRSGGCESPCGSGSDLCGVVSPGEGVRQAIPSRIGMDDAVAMYFEESIHDLGRRAHTMTQRLHPENYRTYVVDRNINYANWCTAKCLFCNFKADAPTDRRHRPEMPDGYVLNFEEIGAKLSELEAIGGTQVLMQGGLVPTEILPFQWYLDLLGYIRKNFPKIHIHAFSPPEIFAFHRMFGMSIRDVLLRLQDAGLDTIPGGGAEILVDRVRDRISRGKTRTDEYLEVMRQAHQIGMKTSITMMFGHNETIPERIEHLARVRELQDETGGFTAFICWTFQPENTLLGRFPRRDPDCTDPPEGRYLVLAGAHDYLKTLAVARVFLDNIPNIQASWVTQGPKIGQLALFFGANDMGSVMMEENVVSAAGTTYHLNEKDIRHLIKDAGWQPRKRDCYYKLVD